MDDLGLGFYDGAFAMFCAFMGAINAYGGGSGYLLIWTIGLNYLVARAWWERRQRLRDYREGRRSWID